MKVKTSDYLIQNYHVVNGYSNLTIDMTPKEQYEFALEIKLKYNIALDEKLISRLNISLRDTIKNSLKRLYRSSSHTYYHDFPKGYPDNELELYVNALFTYLTDSQEPLIHTEFDKEDMFKDNEDERSYEKIMNDIQKQPLYILTLDDNAYFNFIKDIIKDNRGLNSQDYQAVHQVVQHLLSEVELVGLLSELQSAKCKQRFLLMVIIHAINERRTLPRDLITNFNNLVDNFNDIARYIAIAHEYNLGLDLTDDTQRSYNLYTRLKTHDVTMIDNMINFVLSHNDINNVENDLHDNLNLLKGYLYFTKKTGIKNKLRDLLFNNKLSGLNGRVEKMIKNRQYVQLSKEYPTLFVRNLKRIMNNIKYEELWDFEANVDYDKIVEKVPKRVIIQAYNQFHTPEMEYRVSNINNTNVIYRNNYFKKEKDKTLGDGMRVVMIDSIYEFAFKKDIKNAVRDLTNSIKDDWKDYRKDKDEDISFEDYVDTLAVNPKHDYAFSTTNSQVGNKLDSMFTEVDISGSDVYSLYLSWRKNTDIDLSVDFIKGFNDTDELCHCAYYDLHHEPYMKHSGDITRNPGEEHDVSERVIFNRNKAVKDGYKYAIVNAYSYCGVPFNELGLTVGLQKVENFNDEKPLSENMQNNIISYTPDSYSTSYLPFIIDLENNKLIIMNTSERDESAYFNSYNNMSYLKSVVKYYLEKNKNVLRLSNLGIKLYLDDKEHKVLDVLPYMDTKVVKEFMDKIQE